MGKPLMDLLRCHLETLNTEPSRFPSWLEEVATHDVVVPVISGKEELDEYPGMQKMRFKKTVPSSYVPRFRRIETELLVEQRQ